MLTRGCLVWLKSSVVTPALNGMVNAGRNADHESDLRDPLSLMLGRQGHLLQRVLPQFG